MKNLLRLLDEGQALSLSELAEKLNIRVETLYAQIDYLEQLGVLRRVRENSSCSGGCHGCSSKCHDSGISPPTMWERT